jgi:hypothetical protein
LQLGHTIIDLSLCSSSSSNNAGKQRKIRSQGGFYQFLKGRGKGEREKNKLFEIGVNLFSFLSPFIGATVYTQVIESLPVLELPHPNPPLIKGSHCVAGVPPVVASGVRGQESLVSPQYIGGIKGG